MRTAAHPDRTVRFFARLIAGRGTRHARNFNAWANGRKHAIVFPKSSLSGNRMNGIGTLNEKSLHASLKDWYARPGDRFEVSLDGYVIDIVRKNQLIEIQTGNFSSIRRKMLTLAERHPLRLVYPIACEKWIVRLPQKGIRLAGGRRRSPKRGVLEHIFGELVSFPQLLAHPNFSLEVLLILEEEVRRHDSRGSWRRRGWTTQERRLLEVADRKVFHGTKDLRAMIPDSLDGSWTTAELALAIRQPRWLAQKMVYCLREAGAVQAVGKRGNSILYAR